MARPIAGIDEYKFGECGFVVDGAVLKNGVKLKNVRIYKQRSVNIFDLIEPITGTIYQKVQITGFDNDSRLLDYDMTDDALLNIIPVNSFYVRGYNDSLSQKGFVIRFQTNKVILSDGSHAYLFDMYTPYCSLPTPDLGVIIVNTVTVDSTTVTGSVTAASGNLFEEGMIVTLTTPEGRIYTTNVVNRIFTFVGVVFESTGMGTIEITSPRYNTSTIEFEVKPETTDSDYVTVYPVSASQFINNGDGTFSFEIPASEHMRGMNLVIQLQSTGSVYNSTVNVDSSGNITINQLSRNDVNVLIIGDTRLTQTYTHVLEWVQSGSKYEMSIPQSVHEKENVSLSVYNGTELVMVEVQIDDEENITLISDSEFTGKVVIAGKS